jgi:hypothetical protein
MRIRLHPSVASNLSTESFDALFHAGLYEIEFG